MFLYSHLSLLDSQATKNISTSIFKRTKQLTLSKDKFSNFMDSSLLQTKDNQSSFYKLPKINFNHCDSQKDIKFTKNKFYEKIVLPYKTKYEFKNQNLQNKKRQEQFFISELNSINNNKEQDKDKTKEDKKIIFDKKDISKLKKILKFPMTDKNKLRKNFSFGNNFLFKQKKEKQIYFLIDSIFSDKTKNKNENDKKEEMKYDEQKIFGHKDEYLSYLRNELSLLHQKKKELNKKTNIVYEYDNRIYGKIKLELTSVNILVTNNNNSETICSIDIPFNMLCLFYLSHIKELTYIILGLFRNDKLLENDKSNLLEELKDIIVNQISFENDILKYINYIDEENRKSVFVEYLNRRNIKNRSNIKYNFLSLYTEKEAFKQIHFENCTYNNNEDCHISYNSKNSETLKILFDTNINIINFSSLSSKHNFNIKLTMPKIIIYFHKFKKEINHFINRELFVYLLINNFTNFNNFIVHYLFSLKEFRAGLMKALSYKDLFMKYPFFLNIINNETEKYNYNSLIHEKYHISNNRFEEYENSLNDNEYTFYVSDSDNFHLYKMKSYTLFVYSFDSFEDKNPKIFFFNFSFYHMKVLFYKSKYDNLIQFLQRLLIYNPHTKKIFLDYRFFSSFKYMNGEQIDRYFKESSLNIKENMKNIGNEIIQDNLVLRVVEPKFISVSVKKKKIGEENNNTEGLKKVGNVGRKLIGKLIENDIKDWGKILWENKSAIEPLKRKSRNSTFVGKKNFKVIFKKFLKID